MGQEWLKNNLGMELGERGEELLAKIQKSYIKSEKVIRAAQLGEVHRAFRENLKYKEDDLERPEKFKRTAEEIIASGYYHGCSDVGTAIVSVLRRLGVPTIYVQAGRLDWIEKLNNGDLDAEIYGHIFLEVYLEYGWWLYDPTFNLLYPDYDPNNLDLPRRYVAYAKSRDGHETGNINLEENAKKMMIAFQGYDYMGYRDPGYVEVNLKEGQSRKVI